MAQQKVFDSIPAARAEIMKWFAGESGMTAQGICRASGIPEEERREASNMLYAYGKKLHHGAIKKFKHDEDLATRWIALFYQGDAS